MANSGYVFAGWDINGDYIADDISYVTAETDLTAIYQYAPGVSCDMASLNGDEFVDLFDLEIFLGQWLENGDGLLGDIDGNNWVNLWDYTYLTVDCFGYGEQVIQLKKGWNWVSFYILPEDNSVENVLADFSPSPVTDDRIVGQTTFEGVATYYAINDLGWYSYPKMKISYGKMYKIYISSNEGATITIKGDFVDPGSLVDVRPGYNWIGYNLYNGPDIAVSELMQDYSALTDDKIIGQSTFEGSATYYEQNGIGWYSYPEMYLERGKGYIFYSGKSQDDSFSYLRNPKSAIKDKSVVKDKSAPKEIFEVKAMSMFKIQSIPTVDWSDQGRLLYQESAAAGVYATADGEQIATAEGSMISAWIDGVCVGVNKNEDGIISPAPSIDGIYYIPFQITGKKGLPVEFKVYDAATGIVYECSETYIYDDTLPYGTLVMPQELTVCTENYIN